MAAENLARSHARLHLRR